jgi:hypothetical protein
MHMRVPPEITPQVRELTRSKIGPDSEPLFVEVTPEPWCKCADCFENVRRKVAKHGGSIQFGWAVWEWPGVFLEAEHHAVWAPPGDGALVDITPCEFGSTRRLFLPDDAAIYDFEHEGILRDNLRYALVDDPLVDELFKAAAKRTALKNELPGVGVIRAHPSEVKALEKLERRVARANEALVAKYLAGGEGA